MCLRHNLDVLHKSPQSLYGLHLPDFVNNMQQLATYYQIHHISPSFLLSVTICAAAPTNENGINDSPVETPPVLLLIE